MAARRNCGAEVDDTVAEKAFRTWFHRPVIHIDLTVDTENLIIECLDRRIMSNFSKYLDVEVSTVGADLSFLWENVFSRYKGALVLIDEIDSALDGCNLRRFESD